MLNRVKMSVAVAALVSSPIALIAATSPAEAAPCKYYANCDALHRDFPHGVARSAAAAHSRCVDGYRRPSTTRRAKAVYARNNGPLDRDNVETACEA